LRLDETERFIETTHDTLVETFNLSVAEKDQTLNYVGATYSHDNDMIYDGLSRQGARLVSFGPILKNKLFPLAPILELLLDMGTWGMGTPVEIEFAVNMSPLKGNKKEFGVLQMRPLVVSHEIDQLDIENNNVENLICDSHQVLGNGIIQDIFDVVLVDYHTFNRAKSREVAAEVAAFNSLLVGQKRPYLLIGVGRWGSLDPWLGIPVGWEQIAGARAIVETSFKDMSVEPSQGSHFFQNITSFMIGYFTVNNLSDKGFVDWDWLLTQKPITTKEFTRLIRFKKPITIKMNGHKNRGIILKPEV
jgi:hypothetical protein